MALLSGAIILLGCRGLVGIEDLSRDPDSGLADAGSGARDASDARVDGGNECGSLVGPECGRCCKEQTGNAIQQLESAGRSTGCICGDAGACTASCSTTVCSATAGGMPGPDCAVCLDDALLASPAPACAQARATCPRSACQSLFGCFEGCR
jgi:hypothetical protein